MDFLSAENLIALVTLTAMEIVLGIDNVVFVAIVAGRLPEAQRAQARHIGLALALGLRIVLLAGISFIVGATAPLFSLDFLPESWGVEAREISTRDLIMLSGGLFLIYKATVEIHAKTEGVDHHGNGGGQPLSFAQAIGTIIALDLVFSLDSVITAVGMAKALWVMIVAVIVAVGVMIAFAGSVSAFIDRHPTAKMLALAFLLLIGVMLTMEGMGAHVNKGYIYAAMGFSLFVELLNIRSRRRLATG